MDIKFEKLNQGFFLVVPDDSLMENEVELEPEGFSVTDNNVKLNINESVDIELTDVEVIKIVNQLFSKNPNIVKKLSKKLDEVLDYLTEKVQEDFDIQVNMGIVYQSLPLVKDFIDLVSIGVVCGHNYVYVIPSNIKVFYSEAKNDANLSIFNTNVGKVYKNIPVISTFSKAEINSTISKFYASSLDKILDKNDSDYYNYFLTKFMDKISLNEIDEISEGIGMMSDVDLAKKLMESGFSKEVSEAIKKQVDNIRYKKISVLAKALRG